MQTQVIAESVVVSAEGRILLSARVRKALNISPKETLGLRVEDGCLVIEKRADILKRLQKRFKRKPGDKRLLSEELIRERREEAGKE